MYVYIYIYYIYICMYVCIYINVASGYSKTLSLYKIKILQNIKLNKTDAQNTISHVPIILN